MRKNIGLGMTLVMQSSVLYRNQEFEPRSYSSQYVLSPFYVTLSFETAVTAVDNYGVGKIKERRLL